MGIGNIGDVDVIAYASSIGRIVVVTVNREDLAATGGGIQNKRDQVGLRIVIFTDLIVGVGASGVEVAQGDRPQPVSCLKVAKHPFRKQLRRTIGVNWILRGLFRDWSPVRNAVGGAGA